MSIRQGLIAAALAAAALATSARAVPAAPEGFIVYKVGGDGCPYHDIQSAIDDAKAHPGTDFVWIAKNQDYNGQHVVITDQDVIVEGGFQDCTDNEPELEQTTLNGTTGHSVLEIEGTSNVVLTNVVLTGAVMDADHSGGGIYFGGQGSLTMLYDWIFANTAGYGGGIDISPSGPTVVTISASTISANEAIISGGGIRIEHDTTLNIVPLSSDADTTYISQNTADGNGDAGYGGGIEVLGPAVANIGALLALNHAPYGGGVAVLYDATLNLYTSRPDIAATLYGNVATFDGGAIYARSANGNPTPARVCAREFVIQANEADRGAAIFVDTDNGTGAGAYLNSAACDPPPDSVACVAALHCNEIDDNVSHASSFSSLVQVETNSAFDAQHFSALRNTTSNFVFYNTDGGNHDNNYIRLGQCLIAQNSVSGNLIAASGEGDDGGAAWTHVTIDGCTLAGNTYSDTFYIIAVFANFLEITNSIVYGDEQPSMLYGVPQGDYSFGYILSNDSIPFAVGGGAGIVDGAPSFVDAANGDFHLARNSLGVDAAPGEGGADRDGNPRTFDLTDVPDTFGPMDLGAFEIVTPPVPPTCMVADTVFCNGFEVEAVGP